MKNKEIPVINTKEKVRDKVIKRKKSISKELK